MSERKKFRTYEKEGGFIAHLHWKSLTDLDHATRILIRADVWKMILPRLEVEPEAIEKFHLAFERPGKLLERFKAANTAEMLKKSREMGIVEAAMEISEKMGGTPRITDNFSAAPGANVSATELDSFKGMITGYFLECVEDRNWRSLETIASLLKDPEMVGKQGGKESERGKVWRAFCRIHINRKCLPTKKLIRESLILHDGNRGEFSKHLKPLGLDGLPD